MWIPTFLLQFSLALFNYFNSPISWAGTRMEPAFPWSQTAKHYYDKPWLVYFKKRWKTGLSFNCTLHMPWHLSSVAQGSGH